MSLGGTKSAQTEKTPALTDFNQLPQNTSQAAQDVLIPYWAGINRIKTMWVTGALNVTTTQVKVQGGGGKGQSSSNSGQYKYFADFVAVIGMGPADRLAQVIIDNTSAFNGSIGNSGEFSDVNLGQWGSMRLSWGNPGQGPPRQFSLVNPNGTPVLFGNQAGKVRAEFHQLYFGAVGRTSVPTIELVVERVPDVPGFGHGDSRILRVGVGVNPIAVIYEIMTNVRYGLGVPPGKMDIANITANITSLSATNIWISPLISSQQPFRSVIQDLCTYFDGYVRKVNGLIQIGYYTHASTNGSGAPNLDFSSVLPPGVKFKPVGYTGTINEVLITSLNSQNYFIPNTLRAADSASRLITGVPRNVTIDRPHLVDPGVQKGYVEEFLRFNSNPLVTGSVDVTKESAITLYPGSLVNIQAGDYGAQVLCRVTSRTWGADTSGKCTLEFEQERGTYDSAYSAPKDYPDLTPYINPAHILRAFIVPVPSALRTESAIQVVVLAQRISQFDYGFITWVSSDDIIFDSTGKASAFSVLGNATNGIRGGVAAGFVDSFNVTMTGIDTISSVTPTARAARVSLMFVDEEVMALQTVTALGNNLYNITAERGVYGSIVSLHGNTQVWFADRQNITPVSWPPFEVGETFFFKLQTFTNYGVFDLSSASTFAYTIGQINPSLQGVTNFIVGSESTLTIFNWVSDPSPEVFGYEVRYGPVGGNWQQATHAIDGISSAHTVSAIITPGTWVFYCTSYDEFFNHSANVASYTYTVPVLFKLVELNYGNPQHAMDLGSVDDQTYGASVFTNCFVHPTAYVLAPIDGSLASVGTSGDNFFDVFDNFAITMPSTCTFLSPVIDSLGVGTQIRSSIAVYEYLWGFSGVPPFGEDLNVVMYPDWNPAPSSTLTNGMVHPTAYCVVPTSSRLSNYVPSGGTGFEMFDTFVLDPLTPTTFTFVQDTGQFSPIQSTLNTSFENGPDLSIPTSSASISYSTDGVNYTTNVTGVGTISSSTLTQFVKFQATLNDLVNVGIITQMTADVVIAPKSYWTSINGQMRSSPDNVTFGPWQVAQSNFISDRFIQFMATWNPLSGIWPAGISSIWMLLDSPSSTQRGIANIAVPNTTITFSPAYRVQIPPVVVSIVGSLPLFPIVLAQSLTSFVVAVYNQAGANVGGVVNWIAVGV